MTTGVDLMFSNFSGPEILYSVNTINWLEGNDGVYQYASAMHVHILKV